MFLSLFAAAGQTVSTGATNHLPPNFTEVVAHTDFKGTQDQATYFQPDIQRAYYAEERDFRRLGDNFQHLEGLLLAGNSLLAWTEVQYRSPRAWQKYRSYIVGGLTILLIETVLVATLLMERRRAKRANASLEERFVIEQVVSECSTRLSDCAADNVDVEIERGLRELLNAEKVDRALWFAIDDPGEAVRSIFSVQISGVSQEPLLQSRSDLPWIMERSIRGESVVLARLSDLPPEARVDRSYLEQRAVKSAAFVPSSNSSVRGVLVLVREAEHREWPVTLIDRLAVLANIFSSASMREQAQQGRQASEERFRCLFTEAPIGIALQDLEGNLMFVNPALCSMLGYTHEELTQMNCSQFADSEDKKEDWRQFQAIRAGVISSFQVEKRYFRKDGEPMWGRLNVSLLNSAGQPALVLATLEDITEKRATIEDLERAHLELQQFTPRLLSAQEDERRRISRELHDDIGQRLSLLRLNLDILEQNLPAERLIEREEVHNLLGELDELTTDVHNLSHQLHSSKLEHLGLSFALKEICRQLAAQHRIEINPTVDQVQPLPEQVSLCFYRVAQEALGNAVKHSRSSRVDLSLASNGEMLLLRIRDFGVGFDPTARGSGLGLVTMHERMKMIGGTLRITSASDGGTEIEAAVNIDDAVLWVEQPDATVQSVHRTPVELT